jgi:hypothetical protein
MEQSEARKRCSEALDRVSAHMLHVAGLIALSESSSDTEALSERLNTIDNGRIILNHMVQQYGSSSTI